MKTMVSLLLSLLTLPALSQINSYRAFSKADYPAEKYVIKADTFRFNKLKVELTQVRLINNNDYKAANGNDTYCRIWLIVKNGNAVVDKWFLNNCESLGGCSGIYVSADQPATSSFILSKFGDYDGNLIVINALGKIKSYVGGSYSLSLDKRYVFSSFDGDIPGLTVYDLLKGKAIFTSGTIEPYLGDFYFYDNKYFATITNDIKEAGKTDIMIYNFATNTLKKATVSDSYIAEAKKLKAYNVFKNAPCNCGEAKN